MLRMASKEGGGKEEMDFTEEEIEELADEIDIEELVCGMGGWCFVSFLSFVRFVSFVRLLRWNRFV